MFCKLLILFQLFNAGIALRCYTCTSTSQTGCESEQQSVKCASGATSCLTLQFKEDNNLFFSKECSTSYEQCLDYCQKSPLPDNVKDCQVLNCCKGDYCNKKYEKKFNRKRSATGSHSVQLQNHRNVLLLILSSLFAIFGTFFNLKIL